jgi:hypothetical protein
MDQNSVLNKLGHIEGELERLIGLPPGGDPERHAHATQVQTEAINLLAVTCGDDSTHHAAAKNFALFGGGWKAVHSRLPLVLGVVRAAQSDVEAGLIVSLRSETTTMVFDGLLKMSLGMLSGGEQSGAAGLVGTAVLEDALRRLCRRHGLSVEGKRGLAAFNTALKSKGVHETAEWRQIQTWADHRNTLAHGDLAGVPEEDVRAMLEWIRRFLVRNHADLGG